ncbi:MAG: hypothetical protein H6617_12065 [Bdellovibrionaceae bacterium]|nr:hypothetical protein [Pseudobdellovibrionaceae bacterium]
MKSSVVFILGAIVFTVVLSACGPAMPMGYGYGAGGRFSNWEACLQAQLRTSENLRCAERF